MLIRFLSLFILIFAQAQAQENKWVTIYPVAYCKHVPIKYQQQKDGSFLVKTLTEDKLNYTEPKHISDLSNLSSLTDNISQLADSLCPDYLLKLQDSIAETSDGVIACNQNVGYFAQDYLDFVRFTADYINKSGKQCDNMIPLIKLQDQITQLSKEELIKFKPSKNLGHILLKVLTGDETDQMIDEFYGCGGKKGSNKFIKNMILLEAKKACLIPGMLSWNEADEIAQSLGAKYANSNLLKLNKIQDKLSYEATMAFTNKVLEKEVEGMLGPVLEDLNKKKSIMNILRTRRDSRYFNPDFKVSASKTPKNTQEFIQSLKSKQRLDNYKNKKKISDYVSYVFSVDASVEIGEKAIPLFIESSFKDKLPSAWSEKKKQDFVDNNLTKAAVDRYQECIAKRKDYSKYGHDFEKKMLNVEKWEDQRNENALLDYRLESKKKFCEEHPYQCKEESCGGSINMLQLDDSATDTEIIQGCVLSGITLSINPLLKGIIYDQKHEFKEDFDLTDEMAEYFSDNTWKTLIRCANRKVKAKLQLKGHIDITKEEAPLQKISTDDFQDIMLSCSDLAESKVSAKFVDQVIINNPTIQQAFGDTELVEKWEKIDKKYEALMSKAKSAEEKKLLQKQWDKEIKAIKDEITNADFNQLDQSYKNQLTDIQDQIQVLEYDIKNEKNTDEILRLTEKKDKLIIRKNEIVLEWKQAQKDFPKKKADDQSLLQVGNEIVNTSFKRCVEKQYILALKGFDKLNPKHGLEQKNPMLCTPIVEMNASLLVVNQELSKLVKEENLQNNPQIKEILATYDSCGTQAVNDAIDNIGSLESLTPINNVKQSKDYLDKNGSLFDCVRHAITDISFIVAGKQFDQEVKNQKDNINGLSYFASLKPDVQKVVKECFAQGFEEQKNWSGFMAFNENNGLDELQERCSMEANKFVLPKLLVNETHLEMKSLINDHFIQDSGQVGNILFQSAEDIRQKYGISPQKNLSGNEKIQEYFAQALELHVKQGGSVDSFTEQMAQTIETHAIINVHNNLMQEIESQTQNINQRSKFSDFSNYFPASCLQNIYNKFMKDAPSSSGDSLTMEKLASYLQQGLSYIEKKNSATFWDELKVVKKQCDNIDQFKTAKDFNHSKFYELILKGEIYNQFKTEFSSQVLAQVDEMQKEIKAPNKDIKLKYIKKLRDDLNALFDEKLKPSDFEQMMFSDNKLLSFAENNLDKLMSDDPATKEKLTQMLLDGAFKDTSPRSFASGFAKAQIIASIGISGIDDAVDQAEDEGTWLKIGSYRFGPNGYAKQAAREVFGNPQKIENFLAWDKLPKDQRELYINSISYASVIGATKNKDYPSNTKDTLINMYFYEDKKENPPPQDTDPTYFEKMSRFRAANRFSADMHSLKSKMDQYVSKNGYENFNQKLEQLVDIKVNAMNLSDTKNQSPQLSLNYVPRANREDVRRMFKEQLRSYYTTVNITNGLEQYKYSDGNSFIEKVSNEISDKAKTDIGDDAKTIIKFSRPRLYTPVIGF